MPVRVDGLPPVREISAGTATTCARTEAGEVYCWGRNHQGQADPGAWAPGPDAGSLTVTRPARIDVPRARSVRVEDLSACALGEDRRVRCWGGDHYGHFGIYSNPPWAGLRPTLLPGVADVEEFDTDFVQAARLSNGTVRMWPTFSCINCLPGSETPSLSAVLAVTDDVVAIATGDSTVCALTASGRVRCWGNETYSSLGLYWPPDAQSRPWLVPGVEDAVQLSFGVETGCVVLRRGEVRCWGHNRGGQVGRPTPVFLNEAVTVEGLPAARTVTTNWYHTCAIVADGSVRCWGRNPTGELGDGTTVDSSRPVQARLEAVLGSDGGGR